MSTALTNSNRVNIPAVCRLADIHNDRITVGSGVLVGNGVILTARSIFDNDKTSATTTAEAMAHASATQAIFFEGTKKKAIVHAPLLPSRCFIRGLYPAYMDYCLVAIDQTHMCHAMPVKIPLVRREWPSVEEGDTILVIEHPINMTVPASSSAATSNNVASGAAHVYKSNDDMADNSNNNNNDNNKQPPELSHKLNTNEELLLSSSSTFSSALVELKCFEEIVRKRDDIFQLRANGNLETAGCPAFNDEGMLIGIQCQTRSENEGVSSKVISIVAIVQHLFANHELSHLPQRALSAEEVWQTWFTVHDVARAMSILKNFIGDEMAKVVTEQLCTLAIYAQRTMSSDASVISLEHAKHIHDIVECGGVEVILRHMLRFHTNETLIYRCLRALWCITTGNDAHLEHLTLAGGTEIILVAMQAFPSSEEIQHYGLVLLDNIAYGTFGAVAFDPRKTKSTLFTEPEDKLTVYSCNAEINKTSDKSEKVNDDDDDNKHDDTTGLDAILVTCNALQTFINDVLIQKFGVHLLTFLVDKATCNEESRVIHLLDRHIVEHVCELLKTVRQNSYLIEVIMPFLSKLVSFHGSNDNFFFRQTCTESSSSSSRESQQVEHLSNTNDRCYYNNSMNSTIKELIELIIKLMEEYNDNITVMLHGNEVLWTLGHNATCRILILEHMHGCAVLQQSVYALKRGQ